MPPGHIWVQGAVSACAVAPQQQQMSCEYHNSHDGTLPTTEMVPERTETQNITNVIGKANLNFKNQLQGFLRAL